jgi:hypothetical protein
MHLDILLIIGLFFAARFIFNLGLKIEEKIRYFWENKYGYSTVSVQRSIGEYEAERRIKTVKGIIWAVHIIIAIAGCSVVFQFRSYEEETGVITFLLLLAVVVFSCTFAYLFCQEYDSRFYQKWTIKSEELPVIDARLHKNEEKAEKVVNHSEAKPQSNDDYNDGEILGCIFEGDDYDYVPPSPYDLKRFDSVFISKLENSEDRGDRNFIYLRRKVESIIRNIERPSKNNKKSCMTLVLAKFDERFKKSRESCASWDTEYQFLRIAYHNVNSITMELLRTGFFYKENKNINQENEGYHLSLCFTKSLDWLLEKKEIDFHYARMIKSLTLGGGGLYR